jgi:hypothetical protein
MLEDEYYDLLAELAEETERDNKIILDSGGNLDDPPKYYDEKET